MSLKRITRHYNLQLALSSGLLTLSSCNYAFDNQGFSQTQAMQQFLSKFADTYDRSTKEYAFSTCFLSLYNSKPEMCAQRAQCRFGILWLRRGYCGWIDDFCSIWPSLDCVHHVSLEYALCDHHFDVIVEISTSHRPFDESGLHRACIR